MTAEFVYGRDAVDARTGDPPGRRPDSDRPPVSRGQGIRGVLPEGVPRARISPITPRPATRSARSSSRRIKRAGSLDGAKIRDAILKLDLNTVFGAFKVDQDGLQIAHKFLLFQWQDGKKVIVWPEELAPGKPRFPTPPWSQRR